jgi:hypothetical protein
MLERKQCTLLDGISSFLETSMLVCSAETHEELIHACRQPTCPLAAMRVWHLPRYEPDLGIL